MVPLVPQEPLVVAEGLFCDREVAQPYGALGSGVVVVAQVAGDGAVLQADPLHLGNDQVVLVGGDLGLGEAAQRLGDGKVLPREPVESLFQSALQFLGGHRGPAAGSVQQLHGHAVPPPLDVVEDGAGVLARPDPQCAGQLRVEV
ncbi:hypothetical protein L1856_06010 [Streptomyces sp. Tue 6430]|nr:hypothetical protein [Streptomyces sp. Tue 6430]